MPSKKRTVKYQENTDSDGDRSVEHTEEISASNNEDSGSEEENSSLTEQDDERYTPSKGS